MPSYDYRCTDCKEEFTVERSMMDESKQNCVGCGSENANRVWTVVVSITGGSTPDYGQGTSSSSSSAPRKSACGSCVSRACSTC
jgi:putative FmdB family regulatory protein